ncbi:hypothetical protein [Pantoea sp. 1.19]|uniref:hypothetical protein n=1 Tax=Pantoea sp. 1.19 TaxID=1925589 RepID=UPI0009489319|nr:hypothetical protein [Pantoea sp. 1.19]
MTDEAGDRRRPSVAAIQQTSLMMSDILTASNAQSQGIHLVNSAVNQMDNVTQQNAILVEQSAAAATSLANQARALENTVALFRLTA